MISTTTEIAFMSWAINESMLGDLFDDYDEAFGPKPAQGWVPVGDIPAATLEFSNYGDPLEILIRENEEWYVEQLIEEKVPRFTVKQFEQDNFHEDFSSQELEFLYLSSLELSVGELTETQALDYRAPSRVHWEKIARYSRQGPRGSGESHVPGKMRYGRETIRHA